MKQKSKTSLHFLTTWVQIHWTWLSWSWHLKTSSKQKFLTKKLKKSQPFSRQSTISTLTKVNLCESTGAREPSVAIKKAVLESGSRQYPLRYGRYKPFSDPFIISGF